MYIFSDVQTIRIILDVPIIYKKELSDIQKVRFIIPE